MANRARKRVQIHRLVFSDLVMISNAKMMPSIVTCFGLYFLLVCGALLPDLTGKKLFDSIQSPHFKPRFVKILEN